MGNYYQPLYFGVSDTTDAAAPQKRPALSDLYRGPLYLGSPGVYLNPPTGQGPISKYELGASAPHSAPSPSGSAGGFLNAPTTLGGSAPEGPAARRYSALQEQGPPQLHGFKKFLDVLGQSTKLGRAIESAIPGSTGGYDLRLERARQAAGDEGKQAETASRESLNSAQAEEARARANALNNPPEKDVKQDWRPVTGTNWEINSATGETRQMQGVPTPPPKEPAVKNPMSGTVNGKQAYAYPASDGNGFVDANTGARLRNFVPAPSFAETGLYEPTEVPTPGGGMAPAVFNRRSGTVTRTNPQNAPIPAAAQKEINSDLASARNMDRLESAQQDILDEATKRGQRGPMGGGPYLNGPESMQFVSNHIAMTFGGVKGARVGRDLIEAHIKARDLDQATEAAAQGVLSGGVITYQQAQQMMGTAKINRSRMWQQARQAAEQYGVPDAVKMPSDLLGGGMQGGKTKSSDGIDFQPH